MFLECKNIETDDLEGKTNPRIRDEMPEEVALYFLGWGWGEQKTLNISPKFKCLADSLEPQSHHKAG